jgi:NhaP-type Na+/H+ or K+/H+ antiporter
LNSHRTFLGIANSRLDADHLLHESIDAWIKIDSEVLLLTFLPGLLYKDAASLNVHLFEVAFGQCLIFAFPMVLAGTTLTALVCYYIFPYDWSFNLAMTAGSILSATDPVAVSSLLEAVGAPPRLKVHIAGESLLNDGSSIVFFTIFGLQLYLHELKVDRLEEEGYAQDMDLGEGVKVFFQMSCGAVAIGIMFAIGTLVLFSLLDRRLNREENVVEVAIEFSIAYLCYFVADVAWDTSGVIATVTLGVVVNSFGRAMRNDEKLGEDFASIIEHMLNTVLFALGGLVWGTVIANSDEENEFTGQDWGYLIVLYLLLTCIRFLIFACAYPITSRIGLKSSPQEMIFQSFGGLRGAVGIALAISLDGIVRKAQASDPKFELQTNKLFGFVGGIAFMTLMINATTAGPLLRKLGLADTSKIRERILDAFEQHFLHEMVDEIVHLLAEQKCYTHVSFPVICHHLPKMANLTVEEVLEAAAAYKQENAHKPNYKEPNLHHLLTDLRKLQNGGNTVDDKEEDPDSRETTKSLLTGSYSHADKEEEGEGGGTKTKEVELRRLSNRQRRQSLDFANSRMSDIELRRFFLEILRGVYAHQVRNGELADSEFVAFALFESIDLATEKIEKGDPLCDWELSTIVEVPLAQTIMTWSIVQWLFNCMEKYFGDRLAHAGAEYTITRLEVGRAVSFIHAHQSAQTRFQAELSSCEDLATRGQVVLDESMQEVGKAEKLLLQHRKEDLETVISHKFCAILLLTTAKKVEQAVESGVLKSTEAEEMLEELQVRLRQVNSCELQHHEGEAKPYEPVQNLAAGSE